MGIIESILYPFIFILSFLFEIILSQLAEYPILAISLFALIISLLLRPIQQRLREIEIRTTKKIEKINREYKRHSANLNNEQKFYLKERLYKKYSYNPFKSFNQAISFFALIPVLISVIFIFEESTFIKNTAVYGIFLSEPDKMINDYNILPIIMFLLTFVDSFFRYKNEPASRNRFLIISVVLFLIIYDLPSALIIFWIIMNAINTAFFILKK